ncbi:unnamed protein product, partial [Ixodes persulcatus]
CGGCLHGQPGVCHAACCGPRFQVVSKLFLIFAHLPPGGGVPALPRISVVSGLQVAINNHLRKKKQIKKLLWGVFLNVSQIVPAKSMHSTEERLVSRWSGKIDNVRYN